jgi:dienelactone hydrolase
MRTPFTLTILICSILSTRLFAASKIPDVQRAMDFVTRIPEAFRVARPQIQWLENGNAFWFKHPQQNGAYQFVLVDCARKVQRPAFNHHELAESISTIQKTSVSPTNLPLQNLKFDSDLTLVAFDLNGSTWTKSQHDWVLKQIPQQPQSPQVSHVERSSSGGAEMEVTFINRTNSPVRLEWVDGQGNNRPYFQIPPGKEHRQHTFSGHVWRAIDPSGKTLSAFRASERNPVVFIDIPSSNVSSPKKPTSPRAFIRDHNILWQGTESDQPVQLTFDGNQEDEYVGPLVFSEDHTRILCIRRKPEQKHTVAFIEAAPKEQLQPKLHQHQYLKPGDQIAELTPVLINIPERAVTPLDKAPFADAWSIDRLRWNPTLDAFTGLYNRRGHQEQRVVAIHRDATVQTLVHETSPTFIDYSQKTLLEWMDDGSFLWASERSGWNHIYRFDGRTGTLLNPITQGDWNFRKIHHIDRANRIAWLIVSGIHHGQDPYHIHLIRAHLDRVDITTLTTSDGTHCRSNHPSPDDDSLQLSPNQRWLLARWSRIDQPPVTEIRDAWTGEHLLTLDEGTETPQPPASWPTPERFSAPGRDGATSIHGVMIRPSNFDPSKQYPIIEEIYAGPHGHFVPKAWTALPRQHAIAEMGAIVVQIDGMGTNWRSRTFHDVAWRNLKDAGFPDRIAWLKNAAKTRPWMDLSRVGIYGGSAGGQNALAALLHHGDFYKTAVADCGCHDNRMDKIWWNEAWMGLFGPWYAENSNVTHAHKLQGNLLLIVGEVDTNVDPASTLQVASALIKSDRDFELLMMPSTGHGAAETPYASRKRMEFLYKHLISGSTNF